MRPGSLVLTLPGLVPLVSPLMVQLVPVGSWAPRESGTYPTFPGSPGFASDGAACPGGGGGPSWSPWESGTHPAWLGSPGFTPDGATCPGG